MVYFCLIPTLENEKEGWDIPCWESIVSDHGFIDKGVFIVKVEV